MEILYSEEFKKQLKKIKDAALEERVMKTIGRIIDDPSIGKPLRYDLVGKRSVRISPFRLIYEYSADAGRLIFHTFEHRKLAYTE